MKRVVITGLAAITAAGTGAPSVRDALARGRPLGDEEEIELPRTASGRSRGGTRGPVRVARITSFNPGAILKRGALRRLSPEGQLGTSVFVLASRDAECESRSVLPERVGTFLGSGFGSITTTIEYLSGLYRDGMAGASPTLFAESLASAPLGHAAIDLDARGPSMTLTCGDASMIAVLDAGWRAIRSGRIDRAICATYEVMPPMLVALLARLAAVEDREVHIGEGAAAIVLESDEVARASGARIYAELTGVGQAADPRARPTDWSHDAGAWSAARDRALRHAGRPELRVDACFRHGPPSARAARAEGRSIEEFLGVRGRAEVLGVHHVFGSYAAAGGLSIVAAALRASGREGLAVVSAGSWGGATGAAVISGAGE